MSQLASLSRYQWRWFHQVGWGRPFWVMVTGPVGWPMGDFGCVLGSFMEIDP